MTMRTLAVIVLAIGCAQAAEKYQQAKFLEYSAFSPCHYDCQPFNVVYFNFCFQLDNQFLIWENLRLEMGIRSIQNVTVARNQRVDAIQ
jgi:hypothetical protein